MRLIDRIMEYTEYSEAEEEIKNYIIKHLEDIAGTSIYKVASETYTSPATVVRFCRKLGLDGFKDLKVKLMYELVTFKPQDFERFDLSFIVEEDDAKTILEKVTQFIHNSIDETYLLQDPEELKHYAEMINDAAVVDFYGVVSSNTVAKDAVKKFLTAGKVCTSNESFELQRMTALNSDASHLAIIISYTGETEQMINLANILKANGTPIITVTRTGENTLKKVTPYHINLSPNESTFRSGASASRISSLYIIDVLCNLYVALDYQNNVKKIIRSRIPQRDDIKYYREIVKDKE